ncbi:YlaH-like family protein [Robertmurraya andreesenii]|uniref:Vacuolar-type H+-ATPase subunit I/STV1 n=1 Tax=Anoxybacillus andreesenii TaxID=1325932 RepID=A0ABT9V4S9_9BACL|nr:YlaH-like family protein [Robertmurraya andreesenii]MDQ0155865.1 vacuolar-type H+-ATPase subunit I/STV1 [Robertmurraya andreesenii]
MDINNMTFFAELYNVRENPEVGMWLLYITVVILSIIVFKLGFARKLSLLKNIVIYSFLIFGCTILSLFAVGLPIIEGLMVAALILIIYKIRLKQERKQQGKEA